MYVFLYRHFHILHSYNSSIVLFIFSANLPQNIMEDEDMTLTQRTIDTHQSEGIDIQLLHTIYHFNVLYCIYYVSLGVQQLGEAEKVSVSVCKAHVYQCDKACWGCALHMMG